MMIQMMRMRFDFLLFINFSHMKALPFQLHHKFLLHLLSHCNECLQVQQSHSLLISLQHQLCLNLFRLLQPESCHLHLLFLLPLLKEVAFVYVCLVEPTLNYAQVIQRAIVNHTDVQKPSPSVQSPSKPQSPEIKKLPSPVITEPSFTPPSLPPVESQWNRIELLDFLSDSYTEFTEQSHLDSTPLSFPSNPVCIPSCFPQVPKKELFDASVIKSMDSDTLLFAYGYALSDSQRFLIAKALVDKGWKYDREGKTWVMETVSEKDDILMCRMESIKCTIIRIGQYKMKAR